MDNSQNLQVTSLEEMALNANMVVPIPAWNGNGFINVKLRRADTLALIQEGQLPNELLAVAAKTSTKQKGDPKSPVDEENSPEEFKHFVTLLNAIAKGALIEPTYDELVEKVAPLTYQQLMAIYAYCMAGVRALNSFRGEPRSDAEDGGSGEDLRVQAE